MEDFNSRWGLKDDEISVKLDRLRNRLVLVIGPDPQASKTDIELLSFRMGVNLSKFSTSDEFSGKYYFSFEYYMATAASVPEFARRIEALLNTDIIDRENKEVISKVVNMSRVGIRITKTKQQWLSYPEGEAILDERLVEKPMKALGSQSSKEYTAALLAFKEGDFDKSSNKARRTLEEYLRETLNNKKGLQANITDLGKLMKDTGVVEHMRTAISNNLHTLDKLFNDSSKHNSKVESDFEAEYVIYKTGLLINVISNLELKKVIK